MNHNNEDFIQLREFPQYAINRQGQVKNIKTSYILKNRIHKGKYSTYIEIELRKDSTRKYRCIHRLLADTFIRKVFDFEQVHHINGDSTDNRVENLEIVDKKNHIYDHLEERMVKVDMFDKKMNLLNSFNSIAEASRHTGISHSLISRNVNSVISQTNGFIFKRSK